MTRARPRPRARARANPAPATILTQAPRQSTINNQHSRKAPTGGRAPGPATGNQPASAIQKLTRLATRFRDQRDWKQFHNAKDMILSLNLEAAELLELVQWKKESELHAHLLQRKEDLADELCDVLYWVLTIAHDHGINLEKAFPKKIRKNERKYPVHKARGKAKKYTEL